MVCTIWEAWVECQVCTIRVDKNKAIKEAKGKTRPKIHSEVWAALEDSVALVASVDSAVALAMTTSLGTVASEEEDSAHSNKAASLEEVQAQLQSKPKPTSKTVKK